MAPAVVPREQAASSARSRQMLRSTHHDQPVAERRGLIFILGRLMVTYAKPWLSVEEQVERLVEHGLEIGNRDRAAMTLAAIGYYRLTGYLYPFRASEKYVDTHGRTRMRVRSDFRPGTHLAHAEEIIAFDRRLRMLVLEGLERIEVAIRMRLGYVLGRRSAFAYEDPSYFMPAFTSAGTDIRAPDQASTCNGSSASALAKPVPMSSSWSTSAISMTTECRSGHSQRSLSSVIYPCSTAG